MLRQCIRVHIQANSCVSIISALGFGPRLLEECLLYTVICSVWIFRTAVFCLCMSINDLPIGRTYLCRQLGQFDQSQTTWKRVHEDRRQRHRNLPSDQITITLSSHVRGWLTPSEIISHTLISQHYRRLSCNYSVCRMHTPSWTTRPLTPQAYEDQNPKQVLYSHRS